MARGPSDTGFLGFLYGTAPGRLLLRLLTARWLSRLAGRFMDSGLSKPLITHVLRHMQKLGYTRAIVPTQTTTWLACKVYLDLGFRPIPRNAQRSGKGWQIVRTLTDHPALTEFEPVSEEELMQWKTGQKDRSGE